MSAPIDFSAPALVISNGRPTTTSLQVAEYFGKLHRHVMRDIRAIIDQLPALNESNFGLIEYTDSKNRKNPAYRMDRKGFCLLAMGFTGAKALAFKNAYIDAFDAMEEKLRNPEVTAPVLDYAMREEVRSQVAWRAKGNRKRYHRIYEAVHAHFNVSSYTQVKKDDFCDLVKFIQHTDVVPPNSDRIPPKKIEISERDIIAIMHFVYYWKYLFRPQLSLFYQLMKGLESPMAPSFWEAINNLNLNRIEESLERYGYVVRDLSCCKVLLESRTH